jgi:3-methyladenine DNA glycosylase AlkC
MAEQLKEMFNQQFYEKLGSEFHKAYPRFDLKLFLKDVTHSIEDRSLNERMRHTSVTLKNYLPPSFLRTIEIMKKVAPNMPQGYTNLLFSDYVSLYGIEEYDLSIDALHYFTQYGSSEFAIRVFLKKEFNKTLKKMYKWSEDNNCHVRRLASEGSRPRLPWSFKLDEVINNPHLTLPILENLKSDKEIYVQKSVANHLNDISKDHPKLILDIIKKWKGISKQTDWIIKHGSRTLLKAGDEKVLKVFGTANAKDITISDFHLKNSKLRLGDNLEFTFDITNTSSKAIALRIEFAIYFLKSNNTYTKKVFKISEKKIKAYDTINIQKVFSIKPITTRVYYAGNHKVSYIVNGKEGEIKTFSLDC